ncbi:MAG: YeeE/YedE thiosulfate transporter family protein [bacterium]|nr:YeeE/YedE thiosulfate transporter family protein [bacterium]
MSFQTTALIFLLFGIGFGYFSQQMGLCLAHGLGEICMGKSKRIIRILTIIFAITSVGFLLSKYVSPSLGLKTIGQLRGYGFYNLLSGMFFGAGILINGGCIIGTLWRIGGGNMHFLVVLLSFIPGMALVIHVLNPLLEKNYDIHNILLPNLLGVPAANVTLVLAIGAIIWFLATQRCKSK